MPKRQRSLCIFAFFILQFGSSCFAQSPNVLLICVDDLRPELNCYGIEHIRSPNIDGLASEGTLFARHYVQAPTCGASRYALLTGQYGPNNNNALFLRASRLAKGDPVPPSMPAYFRQNGYRTISIGKVSHHPGGHGGSDWNDPTKLEMPDSWDRSLLPIGLWKHPRGWMHGLANGEIRKKASEMDVFQAKDVTDNEYPDGFSINQALTELAQTDTAEPFFMAVGILRPHLPFGAPKKYLDQYAGVQLPAIPHPNKPTGKTTWHGSGEFMKYNRWGRNPNNDVEFADEVRKHYAACVTYADAQVGKLIAKLKENNLWDNTIVILWGDHGWHLGEHAVWGKHTLFEESLHSPLIFRVPDQAPRRINDITETVDIFPTLCELCDLPHPNDYHGESLATLIKTGQPGKSDEKDQLAVSYKGQVKSIRNDNFRLVLHPDESVELYCFDDPKVEGQDVSESHREVVQRLRQQLSDKIR